MASHDSESRKPESGQQMTDPVAPELGRKKEDETELERDAKVAGDWLDEQLLEAKQASNDKVRDDPKNPANYCSERVFRLLQPDSDDDVPDTPEDSEKSAELPETEGNLSIDDDIELDYEQYTSGNTLVLSPHVPCDPYGCPIYPMPENIDTDKLGCDTKEYARKSLTELVFEYEPTKYVPEKKSFNRMKTTDTTGVTDTASTANNQEPVTVKILEVLSGDVWAGPQILLCEVKKELFKSRPNGMPEQVVIKVYDPLFYPDVDELPWYEGPWRETVRADMHFSREAGAFEQLRKKNCHGISEEPKKEDCRGHFHIAPQYYGAYVTEVVTTNKQFLGPDVQERKRKVGVIAMEHIRGKPMSKMCKLFNDGSLNPPRRQSEWYDNGIGTLDMSEHERLKILKIFLDGYVRQMWAGVRQACADPENILIAPSKAGTTPRIALIHYRESVIDSKKKEPEHRYTSLPYPPHPYTIFTVGTLSPLKGWFPAQWDRDKMGKWLTETFDRDDCGPYHPEKIIVKAQESQDI